MKKIIYSFVAVAFMSMGIQTASAHDIDSKKLRFGAFVAPNMSWMRPTAAKSDDNVFSTKGDGMKIGFTYGLMAEYRFAENYSLVTGLQINMTGGKMDVNRLLAPDDSYEFVTKAYFDYTLQYLEIPIALKMRTNLISGFRFFGQLGVTPSFNISKKANFSTEVYENSNIKTYSEENVKLKGSLGITPVLFQMNIGIGAEYPLSDQLCAYFGVFFNNGFAPDVTNPTKFNMPGYTTASFKDGNTRLNNFALRLGLFF